MARYKYVCEGYCGNEVPAERVEKRVPGSKAQVIVSPVPRCTNRVHNGEQPEMIREAYTPARREVSDR